MKLTVFLILLTLFEDPAEAGKRKLGKLATKEIIEMKHSNRARGEVIIKL